MVKNWVDCFVNPIFFCTFASQIKNVCECGLYVLDENYFKDKK